MCLNVFHAKGTVDMSNKINILSVLNGFVKPKLWISFVFKLISYIAYLACFGAGVAAMLYFMFASMSWPLPVIIYIPVSIILPIALYIICSFLALTIKGCFDIGIKSYMYNEDASIVEIFRPFTRFSKVLFLKLDIWGKTTAFIVIPQAILSILFTFSTVYDLYAFWIVVFAIFGCTMYIIGNLKYFFAELVFAETPKIGKNLAADRSGYLRESVGKFESRFKRMILKPWYVFCFNAFEKTGISRMMNRSDELTNGLTRRMFLVGLALFGIMALLMLAVFGVALLLKTYVWLLVAFPVILFLFDLLISYMAVVFYSYRKAVA